MIKSKNSAVVLITLLLLFVSCQPEEDPDPVFEPVAGATTLAEEPGLQRLLTDFLGTSHQGRTESAEAPFGILDYSEITEFLGSEDQPAENYTIRLIPPEGVQSTREYLHLIADPGGYRGYIVQYLAAGSDSSLAFSQSSFTGTINALNLAREVQAVNHFENGLHIGAKTEGNGREETEYYNCNCQYELADDQDVGIAWGSTAGAPFDTGWRGLIYTISCVCDQAPTFHNPEGGGGGANWGPDYPTDGPYPVGGFIPDSGFGGSSGGGGDEGDDGSLEPVGAELPSDDVVVIVPECGESLFLNSNGDCVSLSLDIDQNPYKRLNDCEKQFVENNRTAAYSMAGNKDLAEKAALELFEFNHLFMGTNDCADAFRHAFFSALNTKTAGADLARQLGEAHECGTPDFLSPEKEMDLFNNEVGIEIANEYPDDVSHTTLKIAVWAALESGRLKYLSNIDYDDLCFNLERSIQNNCDHVTHGITANTQLVWSGRDCI